MVQTISFIQRFSSPSVGMRDAYDFISGIFSPVFPGYRPAPRWRLRHEAFVARSPRSKQRISATVASPSPPRTSACAASTPARLDSFLARTSVSGMLDFSERRGSLATASDAASVCVPGRLRPRSPLIAPGAICRSGFRVRPLLLPWCGRHYPSGLISMRLRCWDDGTFVGMKNFFSLRYKYL